MSRKYLIAGNWKMNAGPAEAASLSKKIVEQNKGKSIGSDVLICPPYLSIPAVADHFRDTGFKVGAQNVHAEDNGAYTGEISTSMLKEIPCEYVILGHSERREYFQESDSLVAKKVKKALQDGLKPILCVGEKLEERKNGNHEAVVQKQIDAVLNNLGDLSTDDLVIAYEPVWAIGTGETATPQQAQEMHRFIRSLLAEHTRQEISEKTRILYGGSMKPANAKELLSRPDVDGGLIGGASLDAKSFSEIISIAESTDH